MLPSDLVQKKLRHPEYAVHGRPDLMRHPRDELRLGGGLGLRL